jgi:hypothetical protein
MHLLQPEDRCGDALERAFSCNARYSEYWRSVHSPIRDALGVTTSGYGAPPIYVVFIYFRGPWRKFVPRLGGGDGIQVKNRDVEGIFLPCCTTVSRPVSATTNVARSRLHPRSLLDSSQHEMSSPGWRTPPAHGYSLKSVTTVRGSPTPGR